MSFKRLVAVALTLALAMTMFVGCSCNKGKEIDKEAGLKVDDYIKLGKYTGFHYVINQKKFDEAVSEQTYSAEEVNRPAKKGDEVEFSYVGSIKGKKVAYLSQPSISVEIGQNNEKVYDIFANALIGCKKDDTKTVKVSGKDASAISKNKIKYSETVTFKLKVNAVNEVSYAKVTDKWVQEESDTDASNVKGFYDEIEEELDDTAKEDLWQRVIDNSTLYSKPKKLYKKEKEEFDSDQFYNAEQFGYKTVDEWYDFNGYTKKDLEKEYVNSVKSTLCMWAIVKEEDITVSEKEIEKKYKEQLQTLLDDGEKVTLEKVKKDYSRSEIKEAIYLEKAQNFVYDNSTVKKTYKVPKS